MIDRNAIRRDVLLKRAGLNVMTVAERKAFKKRAEHTPYLDRMLAIGLKKPIRKKFEFIQTELTTRDKLGVIGIFVFGIVIGAIVF